MLPVPDTLRIFSSPSAQSSVLAGGHRSLDLDASLSSAPDSSQPSSAVSDSASQQARRSSRFKQHPSLADYRQRKQILVQSIPKADSKSKIKKPVREKAKTRASFSHKKPSAESDRAKRNLFSDPKPKVKAKTSRVRRKHGKAERRRHTLGSIDKTTTLVLGTPAHKQRSGWHIHQQEKRRSKELVQPKVHVVAESPMKESEPDPETRERMNKPARYLLREAFYSSNSQQSRNFARALKQSEKSDGFPISEILYEKYPETSRSNHGTLASAVRGESPMKSPQSRLLKSFLISPTPNPKSKGQGKTTPVKTTSRTSKRLAKKLDFSNMEVKPSSSSSQHSARDVQLIFDGENAIDFNIFGSPTKRLTRETYQNSLKTPEKQITPSRIDMWSSSSCPSSTSAYPGNLAPELNFRSALFQTININESGISPAGSGDKRPTTRSTPNKELPHRLPQGSMLSSPGQASRLRSNLFCKSPKKSVPVADFGFVEGGETRKNTPTKKQRQASAESPVLPTTPQKSSAQVSATFQGILSTPSKVRFSEKYLISPPAGSKCPPSTEKRTPGKSILKGSPNFKAMKVPRRIQLQPVDDPANDYNNAFVNTQEETIYSPEGGRNSIMNFGDNSSSIEGKSPQKKCQTAISKDGSENPQNTKSSNIVPALRQTGKAKAEEASTSAHCSSQEEFQLQKNRPATIQIRTPSPRAKRETGCIQSWARRKRCSPKQSSGSSSSLISPPRFSKNRSREDSSLTCPLGKENEDMKEKPCTYDNNIKGRASKKRGLFQSEESEAETNPSKRARKYSTQRNSGRLNIDELNAPNSPGLFDATVTKSPMQAENAPLPCEKADSSQGSVPSTSQSEGKLSICGNPSPFRRLTRQCSNQDEGSLGFPVPISSSSDKVMRDLAKGSDTNNKHLKDFGNEPNNTKPCATVTSSCGNRSPAHAVPSTPQKKQYSPSLSTLGLISLIQSPLVALQAVDSSKQENDTKNGHAHPKSRKHLDLG
ncbi:hypothetical protein PoB_004061900 [Plakobranchus ocellatus]|uniref:Uncharacterized protein n=1 Tax=Plakobranchus ocellatus TaxID=259542 RepID=A0AAV4B6Y6_9GAST|nr:hypothetical protein PoB_004061900 [Plakobranchus ocellatus]